MSLVYKLFLCFFLVMLMTAALGGYALYSVTGMGNLAMEMYNKPLMAINFARAAATDFAMIDATVARLPKAESQAQEQTLLEPQPQEPSQSKTQVEPQPQLQPQSKNLSERQRLVLSAAGIDAAIIRLLQLDPNSLSERQRLLLDAEGIDASTLGSQPQGLSERQRLVRAAAEATPAQIETGQAEAPELEAVDADAAETAGSEETAGSDSETDVSTQAELIAEYFENFVDNIEVASERALSDETHDQAERVTTLVAKWQEENQEFLDGEAVSFIQDPELVAEIQTALSDLVEATAGEGFEFQITAEEKVGQAQVITLVSLGVALLLVFAIVFVLNLTVVRPLRKTVKVLDALTAGDTSADLQVKSNDEIGAIAKAVQVFRAKLIEVKRMESEQAEIKARAEIEKREAINRLLANFEERVSSVVENVSAAACELQSTAQTMTDNAALAGDRSDSVVNASETMSNGVQTVAAATEELSSSVDEIDRQVVQSSEISTRAVKQIEVTNATVQGLDEAAKKIGAVVKMISDITEQTNLLALNATIEAARAGEAGKGFAVVANEVKSLAGQTANATQEISDQISEIQGVTGEAVTAIRGIGEIVDQMDETVSTISGTVQQQGAATREIASSVASTAQGTESVSSSIVEVRGVVRETGSSAHHVLERAQELMKSSSSLRSEVAAFIEEVRAGSNQGEPAGEALKEFRESGDGNRRQHIRHSGNWAVKIDRDGVATSGRISDLSLGGALIKAEGEFSTADHLLLEIADLPEVIKASVVGISGKGLHIGFDICEETRGLIAGLLEQTESDSSQAA
ncbi:methyl-accepting chemotaxis protein [Pelagibius sp. Alg239-R121]|uniref:methyl-accepting chemotaxis protein n=1 Tax=Pelagibius sp. Alg239-R121 TaxID=2993448 RepID=UPI0024A783FF|nr:methyl-accepting chemotaxis protein [Pelagibius sp. Alg239-R121]